MLFQNIEFHNVQEIVPFEEGWKLHRAPLSVRQGCNAGLETSSAYTTGVELRFRVLGEYVDLHFRNLPIAEGQMAYLYYGSLQGGWQQSAFNITPERTTIRVPRIANAEQLRTLSRAAGYPFSPDVCRLVLPYGTNLFLGAEGEVAPPEKEDLPRSTLLCYGSSITHGSLALSAPCSYPFRLAVKLGCDYLNQGYAGTAQCEPAMARWLCARRDWHLATLEMGINMMGMEEKAFERRIDEFTGIMADDGRPVFATSIFRTGSDGEKHDRFRAIVRKYAGARLHFTEGTDLLGDPALVSQDMVHPSLEGILQIADRWHDIIRTALPEGCIR